MRTLKRNKQPFSYRQYQGMTELRDADGYLTGEHELTYSDVVTMKANISPATGYANTEVFGGLVGYDKVIAIQGKTDLTENSILWVDKSYGTNVPHDYIVKKIATSLNSSLVAISKVDVK